MKTSDFFYDLPPESIAQFPAEPRESCRLVALDRASGRVEHAIFSDLAKFLKPGDCLVLNNSKVMPARIPCRKKPGGALVEVLLLKKARSGENTWEALIKPGRRVKTGTRLEPLQGREKAGAFEVVSKDQEGVYAVKWDGEGLLDNGGLDEIGLPPLPPYIKRDYFSSNAARQNSQDRLMYQTVFATRDGSAAAPTAGMHFSREMMESLKGRGIRFAEVTLHVGLGTFLPVKEEDPSRHVMHEEVYEINTEAAGVINQAKSEKGRIIAVGTTSLRVLESVAEGDGSVIPGKGKTGLFIMPGYRFKAVDGLLTNFHVPASTLLMLVSAFDRRERILDLYRECLSKNYRFLSYGDAMLLF